MATENFDRLKWRCRRGLLELDIVLMRFLEQGYHNLSREEQQSFETLLDLPDITLWNCLQGNEKVADDSIGTLLKKIV